MEDICFFLHCVNGGNPPALFITEEMLHRLEDLLHRTLEEMLDLLHHALEEMLQRLEQMLHTHGGKQWRKTIT